MPELPEAETIIRGIRERLIGRGISRVEVLRADLVLGSPEEFSRVLEGGMFRAAHRRGKNLVLIVAPAPKRRAEGPASPEIAGAAVDRVHLVVNLGMSGRMLLLDRREGSAPPSHPGVRFELGGGGTLVYHDPRRFGRLRILSGAAFRRWSRSLGPEPLAGGFTGRKLVGALGRSSSPIRSWLLDQKRVAGVGNIYANEALFMAGIHPRTPADRISEAAGRRLHRALRSVLRKAIARRGTTLRDYRTSEGTEGSYHRELRVYGREGRPCPRCDTPVERLIFGGRSAFLCPRCQPRNGP